MSARSPEHGKAGLPEVEHIILLDKAVLLVLKNLIHSQDLYLAFLLPDLNKKTISNNVINGELWIDPPPPPELELLFVSDDAELGFETKLEFELEVELELETEPELEVELELDEDMSIFSRISVA